MQYCDIIHLLCDAGTELLAVQGQTTAEINVTIGYKCFFNNNISQYSE